MKIYSALAVLLIAASALRAQEFVPSNARPVSFPSPSGTRYGFLYVPEGKGPFPAVLWNHGSEKRPGWQPELASFYNSHGFVFFFAAPARTGEITRTLPSWMSFEMAGGPPLVIDLLEQ